MRHLGAFAVGLVLGLVAGALGVVCLALGYELSGGRNW